MTVEFEEIREPTIFNALLARVFVGILLFIALLYRQNVLSLLTFLILLVMTAAKLWSSIGHYRLTYTITTDKRRVFPGEALALETTVENAKLLPVLIRIEWTLGSALKRMDGTGKMFRQEAGLLWYQRVLLRCDLVARHRGVHRIGPNFIRTGDMLGFFEKEKRSQGSINIIVYPRLVCLKRVALPMRESFGMPGVRSPVKDPIYILGTRDYQPSGPSRHIHWKASARHLKLQEKVFEPSEQEKVLLALEVQYFQENTAKEAFERTLEVVASLALQLCNNGCGVGLVINGVLTGGGSSSLPATRSAGQLPAILEVLARLQLSQNGDLEQLMRNTPGLRRGISCAYFSYKAGQAAAELQAYCRRRNMPLSFFVCSPDSVFETIQQTQRTGAFTIDEVCIREDEPA